MREAPPNGRDVPRRRVFTRTLLLVGLTSLLTDLSSELIYPLIPFLLVGTLGASATILGLIEGLADSLPGLLQVYSGRLSDRWRRRKDLAIAGYACSALGKILLALSAFSVATGWALVLTGRVVDRLGKGIRRAPRDALIADATPPDQRGYAFGFHRSMDTAGAAMGVLLAYAILTSVAAEVAATASPWRMAMVVAVGPALASVAVLALIREPRRPLPNRTLPLGRPSITQGLVSWRALPRRLRAFLIITLVFALAGSTNQFLLLRAMDIIAEEGHSPVRVAATVCLLYLVYNLVYTAASLPLGRLSDAVGRQGILVAGYVLYAVIYAAFGMNDRAEWCWLLFALYGLFPALTEGVEKAMVTDLSPENQRATLLGLHGTLQAAGLLPASIIGGLLWDAYSYVATFWFASALGILAAVALCFLPPSDSSDVAAPRRG